ncbi:MAG: Tm-1-like ATP-binding domain-containing protein [Planctomycetaceae bacterium]|nr:Tm-1-like ATP-binding domain-containing protein [Planctomycetaceae bacterium]
MGTIAVLGTLDSKGEEHQFVAAEIQRLGHRPLLIDVGTGSAPTVKPDVSREQVAAAAGIDLADAIARRDRGECVAAMSSAAPRLLEKLQLEGRIDGVISLGGSGGTAIAAGAMRSLPIGFPKLIVSTMAAGNTSVYMGTKDITMMPSIVDVSGLNRISRMVFRRAAGAICGMVSATVEEVEDKPLIVASMFGNTTGCVDEAVRLLEHSGYEVLVFHATGTGGRTMESLIESGVVDGVLDVTTTEWADQLVGGVLSAGTTRLDAAGKTGVPAIVVPGCLDMVNFGPPDTVPERFNDRRFYLHNPQVTLMRTTAEECAQLGRILAEKVNAYHAPVTVLIPSKAISVISAEGQPFHDRAADEALFQSLTGNLRKDIPVITMDCEINDPAFAKACVDALLHNLKLHVREAAN